MKRNQDLTSDGEQINIHSKRQKTSKSSRDPHQDVNMEKSIDLTIGKMNSHLLADYIAGKTKLFRSDLSTLELHDLTIPGRRNNGFSTTRECFEGPHLIPRLEHAFKDTSQWTGLRVVGNLPSFLEYECSASCNSGDLKAASKAFGTPHTIVVTSSGMRAADLTRFVIYSRNYKDFD